MIDYEKDIAPTEHVLEVVRHLYCPATHSGYADFECKFGDGDRTVRVDLVSGSTFEDDFDFASLVGKSVKVSHSHGYLFVANDTQVISTPTEKE